MIRSINNGEPEMANKQRRLCALPNRQSINILRRRRRRRSLTRSSKVTVNVKNREKQRQMEEGRKEGRKGPFPFPCCKRESTNERTKERTKSEVAPRSAITFANQHQVYLARVSFNTCTCSRPVCQPSAGQWSSLTKHKQQSSWGKFLHPQ